ncbi:sigma-70 family RNA polymerase sigma factor [Colwellia sp. 4_MG-2023]|uniref:sigma-70 family RNA polymerase sigma factor n=1 Tax=unclassified Colwellia TaxID=196834 RepID=UPI001C098F92|nr:MULTISPECIES: sigma-70 family RNA polymerase sigma factor [unclassified Colwellia]MBU2923453.1 sigma-70 family RNA polymerase sigma factor [Colwellia sp. C2M11]MDO6489078.1 sigma-70 family RNA polymerase sigma factor [Colwellia sp. 6_MG-2023]MDO6508133.1 sigma-70 family RNA polymerase sigma factor [Colwellia sp. 5_MG-2023]MDO6556843.1 sigma-70 family RNA polymerase sigma factor [Colwellia sp. 4_MG-2023]MDO6653813.1 sigma-70 family RNA polymerase sigma factor [Colwellia sp. 3_MG-2023]
MLKVHTSAIVEQAKENELIDKLINNDDFAYEILVRQYSERMYAVACRFFTSDDDAQETLQKAFIQVFKNIAAFKKDSSLITWLHRITVNEALMLIRQRKRQNTLSLESFTQYYNKYGERTVFSANSVQGQEQGVMGGIGHNVEQLFEQNELKLSLNELIYQLPDKYCNVILLRDIQEVSTKETANILGISEASVKTQLHRARLLLKAILAEKDKGNFEDNWKVNWHVNDQTVNV